jgi:hypothetical protein
MRNVLLLAAALLVTSPIACRMPAQAEEFRVQTQVFAEDETSPVSESLTLFRGGVVYDFLLTGPEQIAIFKTSAGENRGRFILLDVDRRLRTELTTEDVLGFLTDLRSAAAMQDDPLLEFTSAPQFQEQFDTASGELVLASDVLTYRVATQPAKNAQVLADYRGYCDWYARLNAMTNVGSLPPFARLELNGALARHGVVAKEVALTIPSRRGYQKQDLALRAVHRIDWRLSKDDQDRINRIDQQLVTFKRVRYEQFHATP